MLRTPLLLVLGLLASCRETLSPPAASPAHSTSSESAIFYVRVHYECTEPLEVVVRPGADAARLKEPGPDPETGAVARGGIKEPGAADECWAEDRLMARQERSISLWMRRVGSKEYQPRAVPLEEGETRANVIVVACEGNAIVMHMSHPRNSVSKGCP
jgi:hypothetical protein